MKIKTVIIMSFCILFAGLMSFQIFFNVFLSKNMMIHKNENELKELFSIMNDNYTDDMDYMYNLIENKTYSNEFSYNIFSNKGLIFSTKPIGAFRPNSSGFDFNKYTDTPTVTIVNQDKTKGNLLVLQGRITYNNEYRYISITKYVHSIDKSVSLFTLASIIISIFVFLIGIVIVIIISNRISKPIKNIEKTAREISKLNFESIADENVNLQEINNLAKSINSMSIQLEDNISKLNKELEYQKQIDINRKQFVANVSHEMKTPLALLQVYVENLMLDIDGIDKTEYYDTILSETRRLDDIVKDMLKISAIENDVAKSNMENINLSLLCKNLFDSMSILFEELTVKIDIDEYIYVYADEKQISEVIRNYINNAITHAKSEVTISLKAINKQAIFTIYNDGESIDNEDLVHIWDSLYKVDKSRKRRVGENIGQGLYYVKLIIDKHNGKYQAKNVKNGVEFSFHLTTIS